MLLYYALDDCDGSLYLVLLDWSKAFDRIKHDALMSALERFGICGPVLKLIDTIYSQRSFTVRDNGLLSSDH